MPRDSLQQFDTNPTLDTDISGISTAPGWSPANVGPAFRALMSQLSNYAVPVVITMSGSVTATAQQATGTLINTGGAGGTLIIPAQKSWGWLWNSCTGTVTITTGSGAVLAVPTGLTVFWYCNTVDVYSPTLGMAVGQQSSLTVTGAIASGSLSTGAGTFTSVTSNGVVAAAGTVASGVGQGGVQLSPGGAGNTGFVGFFNPAGVRAGYIGFGAAGILNVVTDPGYTGWAFHGTMTRDGDEVVIGDGRTYKINITGHAVTADFATTAATAGAATFATSAGAVAWGGVSGIPSQVATLNQAVNNNSDVGFHSVLVDGVTPGNAGTGAYIVAAGGSITTAAWVFPCNVTSTFGMQAAGFLTNSDERLKDSIRDITAKEATDWVMSGRPRFFTWKDGGKPEAGFIAQEEVDAGRGDAVVITKNDDARLTGGKYEGLMLTRNYNYDVALLTRIIQDLVERIEALEETAHD